jgi:dihydrofolate synthase/folylpolyglutamate synthase
MFSRVGASAYKKDLHNTLELCKRLGQPQEKFRTIHVGGTNGKGSTSHMLASILQEAGYKAGLYTSPHLHDFRERIRVNGQMIPEEDVIRFTETTMGWYDEIEPSFFEITVAMAFNHFAEKQVDVAVIEVGLGGRLDSTNVIRPELSVITNIGWDHMNILGDTLEKIAFEKAGIIKQGIPAVIGETRPETIAVFHDKAIAEGSSIVFADQLWSVENSERRGALLHMELSHRDPKPEHWLENHWKGDLDLPGIYQAKNCITVLEAVHQLMLNGWNITREAVTRGLLRVRKNTGLHGRWEQISQQPDVVLDVGHNEDGMRQILAQLEMSSYRSIHLIIGMARDKDIDGVLALMPKQAKYYFTQANIPRALEASKLADMAAHYGLMGDVYPDVNTALHKARQQAQQEDLILVCGSVFLVGEVNR